MKSLISGPYVVVLLITALVVVPIQSFCGGSSSGFGCDCSATKAWSLRRDSSSSALPQISKSILLDHRSPPTSCRLSGTKSGGDDDDERVDLDYLKSQLQEYLIKRKELGGDDLAQAEIGKVVGGTKGNAVLEYISGSPNKATRIQAAPNALDYNELVKYGYGHLTAPIMKAGGRIAMYDLLGMEPPDTSASLQPLVVTAPKLIIDREGKTDKARYSGLKLGQILDDELQARVLEQAQQKTARGEALRPKLEEETYEQPFADKRNVGPPMTPDWTPERLDEWGRQQGKAQAWARRAREGEFVKDPLETIELDTQQTAFSVVTALMVSTAFGKSTPTFFQMTGWIPDDTSIQSLLGALQGPAAGLLLASVGSLVFCATTAKSKNRDIFVWAIKGLLGGPLSITSLRESNALLTQAQDAERKKQARESS